MRLPEKIVGNGPYADFVAASGEMMLEIRDYGFSEFHVLDPQTEQVYVTHYEFQAIAELYAALDQLISRECPALAAV